MNIIEAYSTHQPLLLASVVATDGRIVELGTGYYSTPLLQAIGTVQGREVLSFDNDRDWMNKFTYEKPHKGFCIEWSDLHRYGEDLRCDVAFVDAAPADVRASLVDVMRRWATIIVVHDTETEQRHNYPKVEEALQSFKYRVDDKRRGAWTTAVSDVFDLSVFDKVVV